MALYSPVDWPQSATVLAFGAAAKLLVRKGQVPRAAVRLGNNSVVVAASPMFSFPASHCTDRLQIPTAT